MQKIMAGLKANVKAARTKSELVEVLRKIKDRKDFTDYQRDGLYNIYRALKQDIASNTREITLDRAKARAISNIY